MKLAGQALERFLSAPDSSIQAVLLYGPDTGLVRERAERLTASIIGDVADPFRIAELTGRAAREEPSRLFDETGAMSLTGGRRVVRLREAADGNASVLESLLGEEAGDTLVVVEAGDLGPRSNLRRLFERAARGAAIPCYGDEGRDLVTIIEETLAAFGVRADDDAAAFLQQQLGGDRLVSRRELEKLAIYVGEKGVAALEDAQACIGDSSLMVVDDVIEAAASGKTDETSRLLERALSEGINEIQLLRAAQRHFQRLDRAAADIGNGKSAETAMKALRPPVFFRRQDAFRRQLVLWAGTRAASQLEALVEAEIACKSTGAPMGEICARAFLRMASQAARRR